MRGQVEVYRVLDDKEEMILCESNLLVDGFGETIADFLTVSPSLSGIESASSQLDVSNYTIKAISFGKPWQLFGAKGDTISAHMGGSGTAQNVSLNIFSHTLGSNNNSSPMIAITHDDLSSVSSITYHHLKGVPEDVRPTDTRLQRGSTKPFLATGAVNLINEAADFVGSAGVTEQWPEEFDNGQNLNLIPLSACMANYLQDIIDIAESSQDWSLTPGFLDFTGWKYPQNLIGCYPPSDGINIGLFARTFSTLNAFRYSPREDTEEISVSGNFNTKGSMDCFGYVTLIEGGEDPDEGLIVSSNSDFSSTGEIIYQVTVSGGDAALASMFGGIWYAGLWTLDNKRMLNSGVTPPYSFSQIDNPRKYRLFSKKMFTKDITYHEDSGSISGLKHLIENGSLRLIWRIFI